MKSLPDSNTESRQKWLAEAPKEPVKGGQAKQQQSDFEKSAVWRGTLIAALIVVVINIPGSPPAAPPHAAVHATV